VAALLSNEMRGKRLNVMAASHGRAQFMSPMMTRKIGIKMQGEVYAIGGRRFGWHACLRSVNRADVFV
jgi:hypothetical protein